MVFEVHFDEWYDHSNMSWVTRYYYVKDGKKVVIDKNDVETINRKMVYRESDSKTNNQN